MEAPRSDAGSMVWYDHHAERYAEVAEQFIQSKWSSPSDLAIQGEMAVLRHLIELVGPSAKGLDAGCGPGARDTSIFQQSGYDMTGVDITQEGLRVAVKNHPELIGRLLRSDLSKSLPFRNGSFDFVYCNSVIQHLNIGIVHTVLLPELVRVLKEGGILQLLFKRGDGVIRLKDPQYETHRSFGLFQEHSLIDVLAERDCTMIKKPNGSDAIVYGVDNRNIHICAFWVRKPVNL